MKSFLKIEIFTISISNSHQSNLFPNLVKANEQYYITCL